MQAPHPKGCGADAWAGRSQPDSATSMHGCEADPQAGRPQPSSAHAGFQGYKHRGLIFDLLQSHLQRGPHCWIAAGKPPWQTCHGHKVCMQDLRCAEPSHYL